jgi:hypothetical protein
VRLAAHDFVTEEDHSILRPRAGYDLVWASLTADLAYCLSMREVHSRDAIEIEGLYRQFILADLPRREGRADLLNELIGDVHYLAIMRPCGFLVIFASSE